MRPVTLALLVATAAAAFARPAAADPHPDVLAAFSVVGKWLDAQNQRKFDAYAALYAPDFAGVKRTAKGAETKLDLAGWKADRKKMFGGKSLSVEIYGEEYGRDKEGTITVVFQQVFRSGTYADTGFKILQLRKSGSGPLLVTREEIDNVNALDGGVDIAGGTKRIDGVFPSSFAAQVMGSGGPCKDEVCTARLRFGAGKDEREVAIGLYQNNAEGESTGDYAATVRAYSIVPFSTLKSAALVVLENAPQGKPAEVLLRRATLVGGAPDYKLLWAGDLLAPAKGAKVKPLTYKAGAETFSQTGPGRDKRTACRAALAGSTDGGKPELLYGCDGAAPQIARLGPNGFR